MISAPPYADLVEHARAFGLEQVYETAEAYLTPAELIRLKVALRDIAAQHRRAKKPRIWWEDAPKVRREDALALHAEGLTLEEVAKAVGTRVGQVRRWLYEPPKQATQSGTQRELAQKATDSPGKEK